MMQAIAAPAPHMPKPTTIAPVELPQDRKKVRASDCAPGVWRKFNEQEKALWMMFYDSFRFSANFHIDWSEKRYKKQQEVTAHNLACQAVWNLRDHGLI